MKCALLLLLLWTLSWQISRGQSAGPPAQTATVYLGLATARPLGPFREAYPGGQAYGATFGLLVKPGAPSLPFEVGLEASYLLDGVSKKKAQALTPPYTVKTTHSYIPLHAVFRLKPRRTFVLTPYVDGLAGITMFHSRSKIKQDLFSQAQEEDAVVLDKYHSTLFSYGLAAGVYVKSKRQAPRLDIRLVYLQGPLGTYVKRGDLQIDQQGYPVYRFSHSETSMLLLQLNVALLLPSF